MAPKLKGVPPAMEQDLGRAMEFDLHLDLFLHLRFLPLLILSMLSYLCFFLFGIIH